MSLPLKKLDSFVGAFSTQIESQKNLKKIAGADGGTLPRRMARLTRPSTASRWGCGSRLRRIWIVPHIHIHAQCTPKRTTCLDWSLSSPAFPACTDAISALRWRARVQVAVARTYPCPASAQEGCPPLQCRLHKLLNIV